MCFCVSNIYNKTRLVIVFHFRLDLCNKMYSVHYMFNMSVVARVRVAVAAARGSGIMAAQPNVYI